MCCLRREKEVMRWRMLAMSGQCECGGGWEGGVQTAQQLPETQASVVPGTSQVTQLNLRPSSSSSLNQYICPMLLTQVTQPNLTSSSSSLNQCICPMLTKVTQLNFEPVVLLPRSFNSKLSVAMLVRLEFILKPIQCSNNIKLGHSTQIYLRRLKKLIF